MNKLPALIKELNKLANATQAKNLQRFFKTGKGEYGEGDVFLGIKIPVQRQIAKKFKDLDIQDIQKILATDIHEYRSVALMILVYQYEHPRVETRLPAQTGLIASLQRDIFDFYIKNTQYINNWDLVDCTTPHIIGPYLLHKDRKILYKLAKSKDLWEKRIAIMATYTFIRNNDYTDTLKISEILLHDKHDLIHKAVGWMLREIGNRDLAVEEKFLQKYYQIMPRTMLRYAIEKFPEQKRKQYLKK